MKKKYIDYWCYAVILSCCCSFSFSQTGSDGVDSVNGTAEGTTIGSTPFRPVELVNFSAKRIDKGNVRIDWQTGSEINNDYFTIERSTNAVDWEAVKQVDGAGNSSFLSSYSKLNKNSCEGTSYYRLKQTSFDGQFFHSYIVAVSNSPKETLFFICPNPLNKSNLYVNLMGVSHNDAFKIEILDLWGRKVYVKSVVAEVGVAGNILVDIDKSLAKGSYIVRINFSQGATYSQKLVVE